VIIPERKKEVDAFYRKYFTDEPKAEHNGHSKRNGRHRGNPGTTEEIIEKLTNEETDKGRQLFSGDISGYPSASEADLALFNKIYWYTQDFDQVAEVYRRSGLYRDKGDRTDYLQRTFKKVDDDWTGPVYEWLRTRQKRTTEGGSAGKRYDSEGFSPEDDAGHKRDSKPTDSKPTDDELRDRFLDLHPDLAYGLGQWRLYRDGVWHETDALAVQRRVCRVLEDAKDEKVRPTTALMKSVTELTRVQVGVEDERWDSDPNILVCENGALDLTSGNLLPHSRNHYATAAVPYAYDPDAVGEVWEAFLDSTVPEAADFLQEFAGYALTTDTSHELAVWLHGPRGSGKSTFVAGLQAMLGHRAGVLGLADIERSRFTLAGLVGKTLVVAREQPSVFIGSTDVLDTIISGEPLQTERKYYDPVTILPRAKVCWAMNDLPRVANATSGIFRRVRILSFPPLAENERNPNVKRRIENEGAGILNWALEGLRRLNNRGHFDIPQSVLDATAEFEASNDVPARFLEEESIRDPHGKVSGRRLHEAYSWWCKENDHKPRSSTHMASEWKRLGLDRKRVKGHTYYYGVRLLLPSEKS
jgi:putative DNA primase/helicase